MELSRPPGVSMRMTTSGAAAASAWSMAAVTWLALTACTTPTSSTTGMSAPAEGMKAARTAAAVRSARLEANTRKCIGFKGFLSTGTSVVGSVWP
jgi:hypothetical protein